MKQTNKQTTKLTSKIFLILACLAVLSQSCTKESDITSNYTQQQVPPKNQSKIATSSVSSNHNYLIYPTQQDFETSMYRISNMTPDELTNFEDSLLALSITPLRQTLSENDTLWDGLENLTSLLNKDLIIQIEDKIIKVDKENDKAYILTPALTRYLPQLRNSELITNTIILHETLDKPIFEEYEEEDKGFNKMGLFCNDRWAHAKSFQTFSWDNLWNVRIPPNGTIGMEWIIRYNTWLFILSLFC
jgi:hypothetical protein